MPFGKKQVPISSKNNFAAQRAHAMARQQFKTYDTSAIKPKASRKPLVIGIIVIVLVIIAAVLAIRACTAEVDVETLPAGQEVVVNIAQGSGAKAIAADLVKARVVSNANKFVAFVNEKGEAGSLLPGIYLFKGGMTMQEVLDALVEGPDATADMVTIPEGYTRPKIAAAVEQATNGRITADDFMKASSDATPYVSEFSFLEGVGSKGLEGFLFPKTYPISAGADAAAVVRMMLSQFREETAPLSWSYPGKAGLTIYDVVKLASIVEKEGKPDNFATVASVFYNRLKSDRPYLESDATTAYEVGHDPTAEEVHAQSPYSTYTNPGLPPTPICNPSLAALEAVHTPDQTDYMFFFFTPDGKYSFSKTYAEHQKSFS